MIPVVGDIWYNNQRETHYLILDDCNKYKEFTFIVLEDGSEDNAGILHFNFFCVKVA